MCCEVDSAVKQMVISLPLKTTKFLIFYTSFEIKYN
jgi:hypothetical protein